MKGALRSPALALAVVVTGCAAASSTEVRDAREALRRRNACEAAEDAPSPRHGRGVNAQPPHGERIAAVRVRGQRALPEAVVREALGVKPGAVLDEGAVARDVRALEALSVFEDVRADAEWEMGGLVLTYHVAERPFVERVFVEGTRPREAGEWFFPAPGDVYDGAAVKRAGAAVASRLVRTGHLDAEVHTHAERVNDRAVDLCLTFTPGPLYRVRRIAFTGNHALSVADLRRALAGSLPEDERTKINVEGGLYRADWIERAHLFIAVLAYERGLLRWETREHEVKLTRISAAEGSVELTFPLQEGPVFHVSAIGFSGALAAPRGEYDALVDVHAGDVFDRSRVLSIVQRADELHRRLGRKELSITPLTDLGEDTVRVDLRVEASR